MQNAMANTRPEIDLLDVNVASIAVTFGCRLVSFDGGYRKFQPLDFLHLIA